ncbi:MAG: efflux RND transporter periplasmic adaptor subunit [Halioglobus sp.]
MNRLHITVCLSLLLAACGGPEPETTLEPVALVTLESAARTDLPVLIQSYGTAEFNPAHLYTLNAEIEARVLALDALTGETVAQDQVLVRLAPSSAGDTEVAQARRDAANASAAAERTRRLRGDGLASNADVETTDNAAKDIAALAASLEARAGAVVTLRAPVNGVVDGMFAAVGDLIAPGTAIVRVASSDAIQARLGIEVEDAARLHSGQPVHLQSLDNQHTAVDTVLNVIDTRVDPTTRMATALVTIPADKGFLSGEAVRAQILASTHQGVITVPRSAVFNDETGSYVFVADNGVAQLRRVDVGLTNDEHTEIQNGVMPGDAIVVAGAATLSDGMKIRTVDTGVTQ